MIPLRDSTPSKRFPIVTVLLIIVNCYIFLRGISSGIEFEGIFCKYAIIPANYVRIEWLQLDSVLQNNITLVSALFLHGGWSHLLVNVFALWGVGSTVERELGSKLYGLVFLVSGVLSGASFAMIHGGSDMPLVGASGAIFGVIAVLFLFMPFKVTLALLVPMPAVLMGLVLAGMEVLALVYYPEVGVAHGVHLSGFVAGCAAAFAIDWDRATRGLIIACAVLVGLYAVGLYLGLI